jgi:hypothetical protein
LDITTEDIDFDLDDIKGLFVCFDFILFFKWMFEKQLQTITKEGLNIEQIKEAIKQVRSTLSFFIVIQFLIHLFHLLSLFLHTHRMLTFVNTRKRLKVIYMQLKLLPSMIVSHQNMKAQSFLHSFIHHL